MNGEYSYYHTKKQAVSDVSRIETERKITQDEYLSKLMEADTELSQIRKDRYCFVYKNNYFELDVYPFWKEFAIIEIELTSEDAEIELPDILTVIREVTEDKQFKNVSLAKSHVLEEII